MDQKKCIVILEGTFKPGGNELPEFKEYSKRSYANGEAHGGVVLNQYMISENLGQGTKPHVLLIIEYPSREQAISAFTCDEYKAIIPLRIKAFEEVKILIN